MFMGLKKSLNETTCGKKNAAWFHMWNLFLKKHMCKRSIEPCLSEMGEVGTCEKGTKLRLYGMTRSRGLRHSTLLSSGNSLRVDFSYSYDTHTPGELCER